MITGDIFDIKKYAIHDGPGIRTTVFFKGCPLSCPWCHNPEGIEKKSQRFFRSRLCIGCRECETTCPENAISGTEEALLWDASLCVFCETCARRCPSEAVTFIGKTMSVDEVIAEIVKDTLFYDESGGGVTFSGGEPLMQPEFLLELLQETGKLDLHRTVDTSGYADLKTLLRVAEHTDLFLYDLKHMDPKKHRALTGVSNEKIIHNLKQLNQFGVDIIIRFPVIPGKNCDDENIAQTGNFAASLSHVKKVTLLPYHSAGANKYKHLGLNYAFRNTNPISDDQLNAIVRRLKTHDLQVQIGG
jgi:pyruvate formate lyase activating enzyme